MSYFKVLKEIQQNKLSDVYLLFGTESFFIQNIIQALIKQTLGDDQDNLITFDLMETPIQHIIQEAETYPFFGDHKVIIANQATFLQSRPAKLPFEHDVKQLEQYLQQPSSTATLVLIAPYESIDGRKRITRQLKKVSRVIECMPIEAKDLHKWIHTFAKHSQWQIEQEAVQLLAANLSTNLYLVHNELQKCAQYVGEENVITKEVVLKLLAHLPIYTALELVDSVIKRDLTKAMLIYRDLKLMNEKPIALIALLAFQFRIILQVKLLKRKGYSEYQMRQKIKAHAYVIKLAHERERKFSYQTLKKIINELTRTDAKIKRGQMVDDLAIEQLLYTLVNV